MPLFHGTVDSAYVLGEVRLHFYLLFCYLDNTILILYSAPEKGHHHEPPFPISEILAALISMVSTDFCNLPGNSRLQPCACHMRNPPPAPDFSTIHLKKHMFSTDKSFRIHRTYTVCQRKSRLFPCCNNLHYIHHPVNQVRIITSENKYPEITFIISSTSIPIPSFPINQTPAPSHLQKSCQIHFPVGGRLNDRYPFPSNRHRTSSSASPRAHTAMIKMPPPIQEAVSPSLPLWSEPDSVPPGVFRNLTGYVPD